jgi:hypothetical protein
VVISVFPLVFLSWIRSFQELTIFTIVAVLAILASIVVVVVDGKRNATPEVLQATPLFTPMMSSLRFLGPATFTYTIHYCVMSMGVEGLTEADSCKEPNEQTDLQERGRTQVTSYNASNQGASKGESAPAPAATSAAKYALEHDSGEAAEDSDYSAAAAAASPKAAAQNMGNSPESSSSDRFRSDLESGVDHFEVAHMQYKRHSTEEMGFKYLSSASITSIYTPVTAPHDITRPLAAAYLLTCFIVIFHGVTGFAFFQNASIVR